MAKNEVSLLKSEVEHPGVYIANATSEKKHKVVAVYDNIFGGKSTKVEIIKKSNKSVSTKEKL